jgi:DNA polymerase-1
LIPKPADWIRCSRIWWVSRWLLVLPGLLHPVGHKKGIQLELKAIKNSLLPILIDPKIEKVAHNAKFDLVVLQQAGLDVAPITFDTMIAEWVINPTSRSLRLKAQASERLGVQMTEIEELIGKGKSQISMAEVSIEKAAPYAAADAVMTLRLVKPMSEDLRGHASEKLYLDLENPLIPILAGMEEAGILLDDTLFEAFSKELKSDVDRLTQQAYSLAGEEFNLNSTQQLSDVLFKKLALEPPDRSRKTSSASIRLPRTSLNRCVACTRWSIPSWSIGSSRSCNPPTWMPCPSR